MSTPQKAAIGIGLLLSQLICASVFCELADSPQPLVSTPKILRVGPTSTPPVIDGDLNDKCWQDASMASAFITIDGFWATAQTTAYVTYDNTCIYIAFHCNEPAPKKIVTKAKTNDDLSIFGDDTVEIFLDTNHDRMTYYHFGINAVGMRYEAYCHAGKELRKADWNPDWELKTRIGAQYWTAEMRIPFASLGTSRPQPGARWGINLSRNSRSGPASWAMMADFNQPGKFGELIFGDYPDVSYSVISTLDNDLKIRFRNGKQSLLTIRAQWAVGTASNIATVRLGPREESETCLGANKDMLPETGTVAALALTVANAETGEVYDFRKGWQEQPSPIEMSLDRYYYTPDVRQMQVGFTRTTKKGDFLKVAVGKNPDAKPIVSRQIPLGSSQDDYNASFDITNWDDGRYVVAAHLQDKSGKTLASLYRVFIKKKMESPIIPAPAPKVSLRSDGIILLDGKPFCPFFASEPEEKRSALTKDCFNVPLKSLRVGLPGWTREQGKVFTLLPEEETMLADIRNVVTACKTDPLLLYWFMSYEATIPMYRGKENRVRLNNADELRKISRFVKNIDPDHPTAIEIDSGNWSDYKDSADIIEVATAASYAKHLIPTFAKDADEVRHALGPGKPFLLWIGSSIPTAERRTAEEIRCASYLALMHGAAGIVFHMGHEGISLSMTRHWSVYSGLSREVEALFPILTTSHQPGRYRIAIDPAGIDYCVREYNNRLYLVAVNTSVSLINARISIADFAAISKRINVLFENRKIELTGSSFVDVFTAFEPHVYEFLLGKDAIGK